MGNSLVKTGRKLAGFQLKLAFVISIIFTLTIYFIWGLNYALSSFYGALVAVIPNMVFAYKAFKYAGAQSSRKVVESFFLGEKLKFVLTAFLFALAFKFLTIVPVPFFITFCVIMVLPLLTPFYFKL